MREIKFRAWDKMEKKFADYGFSVDFEDGSIYDDNQVSMNEVELMQYTGLKDKNGKDIYEGDVVQEDIRRDKRSKPIMRWSVVVYSEKGMFIVECLPKSLRQWNELYKENDEVEVIGNIYENPELLNPHTT